MSTNRRHSVIFLFLHVFVGCALIWLAYTYALEFFRYKDSLTWVRWLLEASFITSIAIWSSIGWDRHKEISSGTIDLWDAISKSTYIPMLSVVTIFFAVIAFVDLFEFQAELRSGRTAMGIAMVMFAAILFAIYRTERVIRSKGGAR